VVRVSLDGTSKSTSFGSLDVAPGGLELGALQVYDYDDDGRDELIVPYEIKATGGATPSYPSPVWSFSDAGVSAYAKAPVVSGGIGIEQLDFDMRPDFGSYGPFVAFLAMAAGKKPAPVASRDQNVPAQQTRRLVHGRRTTRPRARSSAPPARANPPASSSKRPAA